MWKLIVSAILLSSGVARAVPAAPTGLVVESLSSTQVRVRWVDQATTESGYEIQRFDNPSLVANANYGIAGTRDNGTEYVWRSLTSGLRYYFRVRAQEDDPVNVGRYLNSEWTQVVSAVPTAAVVPGFSVRTTTSAATLTWNRPGGPSDLVGYEIHRSTTADFASYTLTYVRSPSIYTSVQPGLAANTVYYFRIRGYYQRGWMDWTTRVATTAVPTISGVGPGNGPANTEVTITGRAFLGALRATFNGVSAPVHGVTATSLKTRVPATATTGPVKVVTAGGTSSELKVFFVAKPPTISSFAPAAVPVGSAVTVNGTNFTHLRGVSVGSVAVSSWSGTTTSLRFNVPAGAVTGSIRITNTAGSVTSATALTVLPAPTITSMTPDVAAPGADVVITGTSFAPGASVTFNGSAASAVATSSTTITAKVPTGATTGKVTVATTAGTATSAIEFVVQPLCNPVVRPDRSLLVTDLLVVENALRTRWDPANPASGAWSFGRLMTEMAPPGATRAQVADFVLRWLNQWKTVTALNGLAVTPRPTIQGIIDRWPRTSDGRIDLTRSPMRLLAIVHRPDLAGPAGGRKAGEGRFVFGVVNQSITNPFNGSPFEFTVILEYSLDTRLRSEEEWDLLSLELGTFPAADEAYLRRLESFTRGFSFRNAALVDLPNQSALSQLRTNEIALAAPWQLREFRLNAAGALVQVPVANTPASSFSVAGSAQAQRLLRWVQGNQANILLGTHDVPLTFEGLPFRGPVADMPSGFRWPLTSAVPENVRRAFSLNTCNGCHAGETGTAFLHVTTRGVGTTAKPSSFTRSDLAVREVLLEDRVFDAHCHR